jgi:hypothetical protein
MRKILLIFVLLFCVLSCIPVDEGNDVPVCQSTFVNVKTPDNKFNPNLRIEVIKFIYEDHQYFWMRDGHNQSSVGGPIHDPKCEKCLSIN